MRSIATTFSSSKFAIQRFSICKHWTTRSRSPGIPCLFHPFKDCRIRRCTALLWDLQIYCSMKCDDHHHQGGMVNIGS
ncbi:hypothetical protein CY35_11G107900 [Sphagnum magellanicum]|nr:hypothetical protein CY35_11G107900 [Sphagnum magellanicum]